MSKGEQTKRKVLEEAMCLGSLGGLQKLSVGGLASAMGMSKSGLFAHFKSKEQLQLDVLKLATDHFVEMVVAPALKEQRGEPRLRTLFERWQRWDSEILPGGCIFGVAGAEIDELPLPVQTFLMDSQEDWYQSIVTMAKAGVAAGAFRKDLDPALFAFEFIGITAGFHRFHHVIQEPSASELSRSALEALFQRSRPAS